MGGWIKDLISGLFNGILDLLTSGTQEALNWVLGLLSATVFASPDVTNLPQVRFVAGDARLAADACMVLLVMLAGIIAMTHGTVQDRYTVKELLPRLVIGFAAANLALPIVSFAIRAGNTVTAALASNRFNSTESFHQIRRVISSLQINPAMFLPALVMREMVLVMLVLLVVTWLGRIGVLLVLAGVAPVALMCHSLPQLEAVAQLWWRSLCAVLAVQVLQAVTLHMAVATLITPGVNLPTLGLPADPTGMLNLLITIFLLWLVIRIPKWVSRNFGGTGGRGASIVGSVIRVVLVQQALGAIGLRGGKLGRRGPAAPAAGGGIRPPATHLHSHRNLNPHLHQHLHVHVPRPFPTQADPTTDPTIPEPTITDPPRRRWTYTARPHPGRMPAGALPAGPAGPPPGPRATPPGAIPLRRPRWQASGTRPSGTGWPAPSAAPPSTAGRPSGTGWPGGPPGWKSAGGSGVRRGR